jgi:hypothetical protein
MLTKHKKTLQNLILQRFFINGSRKQKCNIRKNQYLCGTNLFIYIRIPKLFTV